MHKHLIFIIIGLIFGILSGCSSGAVKEVRSNVDFDLASQPTIYLNDWVRRGSPQIFVSPDKAPQNPPTAIFMPMRITQKMENARSIGYNISHLIWQTWLKGNTLPTIEFAENAPPYRKDVALNYARVRKADLVIGGSINYFVDGGTVGDTSVSISMEIYDVKSGVMLWSFGQSALMQVGTVSDYLLFAVKNRLPNDPATACIMAASSDLAHMVQAWAYNIPPEKGFFNYQQKAF